MSREIQHAAVVLGPRARARLAGENRARLERIITKALEKMEGLLDFGQPSEQAAAAGVLMRSWTACQGRADSSEPEDTIDYSSRGRALLANPPPGLAAMLAEAGWVRRS